MMLAAVLAAAVGSAALQEGLAALEAEKFEEAAARLEAAPDLASSYDGLLGLAVARGRLGDLEAAEARLEAAIRLDPGRPEARVERGGLRFLQHRYAEAVRDLRPALARGEDPYARDLLASSLLLLERPIEAVDEWNRIGRPRLGRLTLHGLVRTRDLVVRRELRFREGETVRADALRASVRALEETGVFTDVVLRAAVVEARDLDVELLLAERHGFGAPLELASATLTNALVGRARLRYANLGGHGIGVGAFYRWEGARPRLEGVVDWPRPFGLPFQWRVAAYRERQPYDVGGPFLHRARGVESSFRRILDGRTGADLGLRWRRRSFDAARPFAPPGNVMAVDAGLDRVVLERETHRIDVRIGGLVASRALGSDLGFESTTAAVRYRLGRRSSQLVARLLWGRGSDGLPVDSMFAPGAAPDALYPLRGHPLRQDGVLGTAPIGRSLWLGNLEWRREVWSGSGAGVGIALFNDVAMVRQAVVGPSKVLVDAGFGVRFRVGPSVVFRMDYGFDLRNRRSLLSGGVGEAF